MRPSRRPLRLFVALAVLAAVLVFAGLAQGVGAWRLSDGVRRWRCTTSSPSGRRRPGVIR
jgi:hypothetical protein